jgi:hypothetical protein
MIEQVPDDGKGFAWIGELPAHHQHQTKAEKHEQERGHAVLQADDLVVGGKDVFPPKPKLMMRLVVNARIRMVFRLHGYLLHWQHQFMTELKCTLPVLSNGIMVSYPVFILSNTISPNNIGK